MSEPCVCYCHDGKSGADICPHCVPARYGSAPSSEALAEALHRTDDTHLRPFNEKEDVPFAECVWRETEDLPRAAAILAALASSGSATGEERP